MARKDLVFKLLTDVFNTQSLLLWDMYGPTVEWATQQGLLGFQDPNWVLTEKGLAFWNQLKVEKEVQRKKNNQAARARSAALSSVGMRRTRSGSWE